MFKLLLFLCLVPSALAAQAPLAERAIKTSVAAPAEGRALVPDLDRAVTVSSIMIGQTRVRQWSDGAGRAFLDLPEGWGMAMAVKAKGAHIQVEDAQGVHEATHDGGQLTLAPWKVKVNGEWVNRFPFVLDGGVCFTFTMDDTALDQDDAPPPSHVMP